MCGLNWRSLSIRTEITRDVIAPLTFDLPSKDANANIALRCWSGVISETQRRIINEITGTAGTE
jgi:hypothetical protein